ncbi:DinB family protein [Flaviramulus aquimarinus]|uniref:DinB family protein n=1 Tax=Flaviramulus aquimarinus TaxID=1170456 RepID=A0ABP9EQX0_9FLAO
MIVTALKSTEYNSFYNTYISKVPKHIDLIYGFKTGENHILDFFNTIPEEKLNYRYAENKWSVKEVFQHIIDTERVFIYRCFTIARHDKTALAGFEQDDYIVPSKADKKTIEDLFEEYKAVRLNSIVLLKSLNDDDLSFIGNANGSDMSARAAAFVILGHEIHHMDVIKKRYL